MQLLSDHKRAARKNTRVKGLINSAHEEVLAVPLPEKTICFISSEKVSV